MFSRKRTAEVTRTIATSLIAHGTRVIGDVHFEGSLFLEGQVDGKVVAIEPGALLTIGEQGLVQGDLRVPAAIIHGDVRGNVYAMERLELAATARVAGDVCYSSIVVTAGAQIQGRLQHASLLNDEDTALHIAAAHLITAVMPAELALEAIATPADEVVETSSTNLGSELASDSSLPGLQVDTGFEPVSDRRSRKRGRQHPSKPNA
ncbi:bactofilin family protein [Dyella japonica]|uniref:bactofilin family protein n=1 Tax=Dyella japonica TaxID=231455 RepID=UPI00069B636A|nr:polymer-forming cytoskeletal protein [Dyella japonica]